jgi:hypothetical protein
MAGKDLTGKQGAGGEFAKQVAGQCRREQPSTDGKRRGSRGKWMSPKASDCEWSGATSGRPHEMSTHLGMQVKFLPLGEKHRGSLNPAWVSQLMGYPDGWLDLPEETLCRLWGTRSCRKSRQKSSGRGMKRN